MGHFDIRGILKYSSYFFDQVSESVSNCCRSPFNSWMPFGDFLEKRTLNRRQNKSITDHKHSALFVVVFTVKSLKYS